MVWTAETKNDEGRPEADAMSASYNAAIKSAHTRDCDRQLSAFVKRVEREANRRGFYDAGRQAVIGEGARWIWRLVDEIFPMAIQTVDLYTPKRRFGMLRNQCTGKRRT